MFRCGWTAKEAFRIWPAWWPSPPTIAPSRSSSRPNMTFTSSKLTNTIKLSCKFKQSIQVSSFKVGVKMPPPVCSHLLKCDQRFHLSREVPNLLHHCSKCCHPLLSFIMYAHSWGMKNGFSDVTAQQKVPTFDNETN